MAIGGPERGPLQPFDVIRVMNGQVVRSGQDIQATIESQDPGATFRYIVYRRGELVEVDVRTRLFARRDFLRFVVESLLPGLLQLAIGAVVFMSRPGRPQSWLFLVYSLIAYLVTVTYADAHTTYRFSGLFLTAWAFWPATLLHLALTFPQRRRILRRFQRLVWLPYLISAVVALLLQLPLVLGDVRLLLTVPAAGAAYWGVALLLLVLALARTSVVGSTPLIRQRARTRRRGVRHRLSAADPRDGHRGAVPGSGPVPQPPVEGDAPVPGDAGLRDGPLRPVRRARCAPGRRRVLGDHGARGARLYRRHRGGGHPPDDLGGGQFADRGRGRDGGAGRGAAEPPVPPVPAAGRPPVLPPARRRAAVDRARVRGHERTARPPADRRAAHPYRRRAAPSRATGALPLRRPPPRLRSPRSGRRGRE